MSEKLLIKMNLFRLSLVTLFNKHNKKVKFIKKFFLNNFIGFISIVVMIYFGSKVVTIISGDSRPLIIIEGEPILVKSFLKIREIPEKKYYGQPMEVQSIVSNKNHYNHPLFINYDSIFKIDNIVLIDKEKKMHFIVSREEYHGLDIVSSLELQYLELVFVFNLKNVGSKPANMIGYITTDTNYHEYAIRNRLDSLKTGKTSFIITEIPKVKFRDLLPNQERKDTIVYHYYFTDTNSYKTILHFNFIYSDEEGNLFDAYIWVMCNIDPPKGITLFISEPLFTKDDTDNFYRRSVSLFGKKSEFENKNYITILDYDYNFGYKYPK